MNYSLATYSGISPDSSSGFRDYLRKIAKFPMLSCEEEIQYLETFHANGDKKAGQALVTSHLRLVVKMACYYKYKGCQLSIMDLISEGTVGLLEAIRKFDFKKQCRLATYAAYHIKAKMYDFIMHSFSIVKMGTGKVARSLFGKYKEIVNSNSEEEIEAFAETVDIDVDSVKEAKNRFEMRDWSLNNKMYGDEESSEFIDELESIGKSAEDLALEYDFKFKYLSAIKKACEATLSEDEKEIIYHRIIAEKPSTLKEVAKIFNVTPEAIRQKQEKALNKIRQFIANAGLLENKNGKLLKIT